MSNLKIENAYEHAYKFGSKEYDVYNSRQEHGHDLLILEYGKLSGRGLFAFGTRHVAWLEDEVREEAIGAIIDAVRDYLEKVPAGSRLFMVEGVAGNTPAAVVKNMTLGDAFDFGENLGVSLLAVQAGSDVISPEPNDAETTKTLLGGFPMEKLFLFYTLWAMPPQPDLQGDLAARLVRYLGGRIKESFTDYSRMIKDGAPYPEMVDLINKNMREACGKDLLRITDGKITMCVGYDSVRALTDPTVSIYKPEDVTIINQIAERINVIRDMEILKIVDEEIGKGKRPFLIYGWSHIARLKGSLDFLYGEPVSIKSP